MELSAIYPPQVTMKISELQLSRYWFRSVEVSENAAHDAKAETATLNMEVATSIARKADGSREWRVDLKVKSGEPNNGPYNFLVEVSGIFHITDAYPNERLESLIQANGPAVLFGTAREMIAHISCRGLQIPPVLPLVTFIDQIKSPDLKTAEGLAPSGVKTSN
jgi:preprotein translocase subunit SecB